MKFAVVALLSVAATPSAAAVLDLQFDIDIATAYSYPFGGLVSNPYTGTVNLRLDLGNLNAVDYGTTTASYGKDGSAVFHSPLTALVGPDPIGGGISSAYSYAFPHTTAYDALLIEQVAGQSNAYSSDYEASVFWTYHIELRIDQRSEILGGATDYAMELDDMLRIVGNWYRNPDIGYFSEYWSQYSLNEQGSLIYSAGYSWEDYSPTLTAAWLDGQSINLEALEVAPVPLPAAGLLFAGAVAFLGLIGPGRLQAADA